MIKNLFFACLVFFASVAISCAQALPHVNTWAGNTYGGVPFTTSGGWQGNKHVQLAADDMTVAPDGTVYTDCAWDEGGMETGIYRDDALIGNCQDLSHGWGRQGGHAVAVDDRYVYVAMTQNGDDGADDRKNTNGLANYPPRGTQWYCVRRFHRDGSHAPFPGGYGVWGDMMILDQATRGAHGYPDAGPAGMAVSGGRLYVSDPAHNRIAIYDAAAMTGTPVSSWVADAPGKIVADGAGGFWVLGGTSPSIAHYFSARMFLPQQITFAPSVVPSAIAWDAAAGRLLVADRGPDQNVKLYDPAHLSGNPTRPASTFGVRGGIHAGADGRVGQLRFCDPDGVGADMAGNIYVASSNAAGGGPIFALESYQPTGKPHWAAPLQCLEFVARPAADPDAQTDLYSTDKHYTFDYTQPPGQGWAWRGMTLDRFKYPDDPRLHVDLSGGVWVRHIHGAAYLFLTQQMGSAIGVLRLSPTTDGETAVPYALISAGPQNGGSTVSYGMGSEKPAPWPLGAPAQGEWIWRDADGNGKVGPSEVSAPPAGSPATYNAGWGKWVDSWGDIWQSGRGHIRHFKMRLDAHGRPVWDYAPGDVEVLDAPPLPNGAQWRHGANPDNDDLARIVYEPETDTMYLSGFTTDYPDDSGAWGTTGRVVYRYDHWSGARTIHPGYPMILPWGTKGSQSQKSLCVAGNDLFSVQGMQPEAVSVYDVRTAALVGTMTPDVAVGSQSGWVDMNEALTAYQRPDGEYIVIAEEDWLEKALMYRWRVTP